MELHYILVVLVIIAIIVAQIYIYRNTKKKIATYKSIFPNSTSSYSIVEKEIQTESCSDDDDVYVEDIDTISVSQLNINTDNETLKEIRDALNMYLQKNRGAASDFYLMKDVVERYCDAEEEEINIQQPIPLYLGLMGTMVGIIVGILMYTIYCRKWRFIKRITYGQHHLIDDLCRNCYGRKFSGYLLYNSNFLVS